jgi:hypothetical protein
MEIEFNSDDDTLDKYITFTEADYAVLQTNLQEAACNSKYSDAFTITGLNSTTSATMTWTNKNTIYTPDNDDDDIPEIYRYQTDTLAINLNYPLFLYFYNGTKTQKRVLELDKEEEIIETKIELTDVTTANECVVGHEDYNGTCDFLNTPAACTITIDGTALTNTPGHDTQFLTGCTFLQSN